MGACSASHAIAAAASDVQNHADAIDRLSVTLQRNEYPKNAQAIGTQIQGEAQAIKEATKTIHESIAGVQDVVPAWMILIQWILIVAAISGGIFLLSASGLLTVIRLAINWIPRPKRVEASLAAAALDPAQAESTREWIAAKRASDPLFDRAYKQEIQNATSNN